MPRAMDLARAFGKAAHAYHGPRDVHDAMTNQKRPSKERRHRRRRSCTFKTADPLWSLYRDSLVVPLVGRRRSISRHLRTRITETDS